jgi:hypothetical protein
LDDAPATLPPGALLDRQVAPETRVAALQTEVAPLRERLRPKRRPPPNDADRGAGRDRQVVSDGLPSGAAS